MTSEEIKIGRIFEVAELYRPTGKPIMTPIKEFDDAMDGGVRGGEMITISGQTGAGKTSWALWMTKKIVDSGVPTLWFTYEMNPWYLKEKLVALGAKEDFAMFVPIEHKDNTEDWIRNVIIEAQKAQGCKIVFIDHLHYLIPPNQERNASLMIGGIARKVKQLAVETDTIIFLIAHMRRLEMGEKANIDAIRDSALIANESDYVYLVDRIKRKKKKLDNDPTLDETTNVSRVSLAKNRRTGRMFNKYFEVNNSNFNLIDDERVKRLKQEMDL